MLVMTKHFSKNEKNSPKLILFKPQEHELGSRWSVTNVEYFAVVLRLVNFEEIEMRFQI